MGSPCQRWPTVTRGTTSRSVARSTGSSRMLFGCAPAPRASLGCRGGMCALGLGAMALWVSTRPSAQDSTVCNGRGTLGSPMTARPGKCSPRPSHPLPCGERNKRAVSAQVPRSQVAQTRRSRLASPKDSLIWVFPRMSRFMPTSAKFMPRSRSASFPGQRAKSGDLPSLPSAECVSIRAGRGKFPLLLLLLTFSPHGIYLLLGNLGRGTRSQSRVRQTPAKLTLAELGRAWHIRLNAHPKNVV
ncbi:hypothetical protein BKA10_002226 [Microbacterium invictum]|uniref:Uncharacterized protein n=1 Tax=Microbacterium invictum TaxID=515415 RepID=A0AA40VN19_9MICO|nr:hypothetical protein [Microbacterium invictum]